MPTAADAANSQPSTVEKEEKGQNPALARAESKLLFLTKNAPTIRRVVRAAARLADLCTGEDLEADARVIRDATNATHRCFNTATKQMEIVPDHKTRLAAVTLRRAYVEGLPVKRAVTLTGKFVSADEILDRMRRSPEALRLFPHLAAPDTLEGGVQETG